MHAAQRAVPRGVLEQVLAPAKAIHANPGGTQLKSQALGCSESNRHCVSVNITLTTQLSLDARRIYLSATDSHIYCGVLTGGAGPSRAQI